MKAGRKFRRLLMALTKNAMVNKIVFSTIIFLIPVVSYGQDLLSAGYGYDYAKDTIGIEITIDLNRKPAAKEGEGKFWIYKNLTRRNYTVGKSCYTDFFLTLKPFLDVNLGSSTALSPNNVSLGLPFTLGVDLYGVEFLKDSTKRNLNKKDTSKHPLPHSLLLQLEPKYISNKDFSNALYVFEPGLFWYTIFNRVRDDGEDVKGVRTIEFTAGFEWALGERRLYEEVPEINADVNHHDYSRLSIPLQLDFELIEGRKKSKLDRKEKSRCEQEKDLYQQIQHLKSGETSPQESAAKAADSSDEEPFSRIILSVGYQYNKVLNDFEEIANPKEYEFFSSKLTYNCFIFRTETGILVEYQKGRLEPLFKKTDALRLGIVFKY